MIFPKSLTKGSTIGIVAPAGKIDAETIHFAEKCLHKRGYKVVVGDNVCNSFHQFAGNDEHRAGDLQHMLNSPEVDAIFCARGGYGTIRIIDKIDFTHFLEYPKWLIGYSDIQYGEDGIEADEFSDSFEISACPPGLVPPQ